MTGTQSTRSVPSVVTRDRLGSLGEDLGRNNGESKCVCLIPRFPGLIYKEYLRPVSVADVQRLDRLINLPATLGSADSAVVAAHTSWPQSRVVNATGESIGVLMPVAPDRYMFNWEFRPGRSRHTTLEVDVLALPAVEQAGKNLPPQSVADRVSVCADLAQVGALFERYGLVYLDWSYSNAFWSPADHTAYVIDMDGCSFGRRGQIEQPNWGDPLVPRGRPAGNESDRYRLALLMGRCLTGERGDPVAVRSALNDSLRRHSVPVEKVAELLIQALSAQSTTDRPPIVKMFAALSAADRAASASRSASAGGVKNWKPITSRPAGPRPDPVGSRPAPAGTTAGSGPTPVWAASGTATRAGAYSSSRSSTLSNGTSRNQPVKSSGGSAGLVLFVILAFIALVVILALII